MQVTIELSDKSCILCDGTGDTVEAKFKDKRFSGVLCLHHLMELMKRGAEHDVPHRQPSGRSSATVEK
jgi:hypothetical protein